MLVQSLLLLSSLFLGPAAAGPVARAPNAPVNIPLTRHVDFSGSASVVQRDSVRIAALLSGGDGPNKRANDVKNSSVENSFVIYTASVDVGSPPTSYDLIVDTGSSNTWVGADQPYQKTSTSKDMGCKVEVTYGSGSFSGEEYTDQVILGDDLQITDQSIGVASTSSGFDGFDGILGVGPTDLTEGTLSCNSQTVPTVVDNLYEQGSIPAPMIGVLFNPATSTSPNPAPNGRMDWGGVDPDFAASVTFVPKTKRSPSSSYWGIDQSITYGNETLSAITVMSQTAGIVDTGTTLIYLESLAFQKYKLLTGAEMDNATGLLSITPTQYSNLKNLNFNVHSCNDKKQISCDITATYALIPDAQLWPRLLNTAIGGEADAYYLIVADLGTVPVCVTVLEPGACTSIGFINGYNFLERFYSVYDSAGDGRIGFSQTPNTNLVVNSLSTP